MLVMGERRASRQWCPPAPARAILRRSAIPPAISGRRNPRQPLREGRDERGHRSFEHRCMVFTWLGEKLARTLPLRRRNCQVRELRWRGRAISCEITARNRRIRMRRPLLAICVLLLPVLQPLPGARRRRCAQSGACRTERGGRRTRGRGCRGTRRSGGARHRRMDPAQARRGPFRRLCRFPEPQPGLAGPALHAGRKANLRCLATATRIA